MIIMEYIVLNNEYLTSKQSEQVDSDDALKRPKGLMKGVRTLYLDNRTLTVWLPILEFK